MPVQERRAHPRYPTEGVHGSIVFGANARLLNIGRGGLAVETSTRLGLRSKYTITIDGPDGHLELPGRIVRCSLVGTRPRSHGDFEPVYEVGIRFDELIPEERVEMLARMGTVEDVDPEKRLFGRFRTTAETTVAIDSEAAFEVEKISRGGMQLRTELAPEPDSFLNLEVDLDGAPFEARGRVAFVERVTDHGSGLESRLGLEFIGLDESSQATLDEYISRLATQA